MSITTSKSELNIRFLTISREALRYGCELKMDEEGAITIRVNTSLDRHPGNDLVTLKCIDVVDCLADFGIFPESFQCTACGPSVACYHCVIHYAQEDFAKLIPCLEEYIENEDLMNEEKFSSERCCHPSGATILHFASEL